MQSGTALVKAMAVEDSYGAQECDARKAKQDYRSREPNVLCPFKMYLFQFDLFFCSKILNPPF